MPYYITTTTCLMLSKLSASHYFLYLPSHYQVIVPYIITTTCLMFITTICITLFPLLLHLITIICLTLSHLLASLLSQLTASCYHKYLHHIISITYLQHYKNSLCSHYHKYPASHYNNYMPQIILINCLTL